MTGKKGTAGASSRTFVALLRGVNVGGNNKLPMKELARALTSLGLLDVRTYIQSGNVVFRVAGPPPREVDLVLRLEKHIAKTFKLEVPVVLRSVAEIGKVVAENPHLVDGAVADLKLERIYVAFMASLPVSGSVAKLDPARSPPDIFAVRGREIFLHLPNTGGQSKLTNAYFDKQLGTTTTMRNWNTVTTLLTMMQEP